MTNLHSLIEFIATQGDISKAQAEKVVTFYRKNRIVKHNAHDGYQVKHGAFYDRDVILKALAQID